MESVRKSLCIVAWVLASAVACAEGTLDLTGAVLVRDAGDPVIVKAATMLAEEIGKRAGTQPAMARAADAKQTAIILGLLEQWPGPTPTFPAPLAAPDKKESYALWADTKPEGTNRVYVVGHDARGVLFGVGRLLRTLEMRPGQVSLPATTAVASAPDQPIRGHHFGYDDTNNTFDAWTLAQFEQQFRDLIVFGMNTVELSLDFKAESPHMPVPAEKMNIDLSRLVHSYGLDVWIFHALHGDVSDPALAEQELARSAYVFEKMPYLDAVFVPGGDPGETPPQTLMPFLAKLAELLHKHHPGAALWLSNQAFEDSENDYLYDYLANEKPAWLKGMVFGPWTKITIREARERTPSQYPIRSYPDMTHNVRSQFPVPHWDRAFAHTLGRECANPRPFAQAQIHHNEIPYCDGSIPYSEGVNDDVNKVVWLARSWDTEADIAEVMRDYGRYFIGEDLGPAIAEGLLAEEKNWEAPLLNHPVVSETFAHWQAIEQKADMAVKNNWRFQLGLIRAYYDEYLKQRLAVAVEREANAYAALRTAETKGPEAAIAGARAALAADRAKPVAPELKARIEDLGAALFQNIGMQLDVKRYGAKNPERGAILEFLDTPLNDAPWLTEQFDSILAEKDRAVQLERIAALLNWENPGPGSFYDDLGNATKEPHLVPGKPWSEDPGFVESPQDEFTRAIGVPQDPAQLEPAEAASAEKKPAPRLSWLDQGQTLFRTDLRMHFDGLDTGAAYTLRAVYYGRFKATMRLTADDQYEVHGPVNASDPPEIVEFPIPAEATKDGVLDLRWTKTEGRGCQVAEVWLLRNP
ncbi:MAG: hypothetical protein IT364_19715 [Candidatus Hydrogenedentes bacterium]|nr:hypothetical protein [Candidatus Hydrogenedentota bacterium]